MSWLLQLLSSTISWISMLCFPLDPLSLANVSVQPGRRPQELHVSWVESGGGRDHLVQLSVAESLSIIRNVSVPRGVTQLDLEGLVPGSRYRVEIISQAGPHRISSQTAIGYTGRNAASLHPSPSLVPSLALTWRGAGDQDGGVLGLFCKRALIPCPCNPTGACLLLKMLAFFLGPSLILSPAAQWGML